MVEKNSSETPEFTEADFLIPASDTKGHSRRAQFRTQPGHINMAESIVSSGKFPFRTKGDLYRFALSHTLKFLEKQKPVASTTKQVDAILEVMRNERFSTELKDTIDKLNGQVADLISAHADQEARRLVLKVRRLVAAMPEGYWRDRYVNEMKDRFGYLLSKSEKASLVKLNQE